MYTIKEKVTTSIVLLIVVVFVVLYFLGYLGGISESKKTKEEIQVLKTQAKSLMLAGELDSFAGKITKIGNNSIFIKVMTPNYSKVGEEIKVQITNNTLIRKIEFPEVQGDGAELIPAEEIILRFEELKINDEVFLDINNDSEALMIDLVRRETSASPSAYTGGEVVDNNKGNAVGENNQQLLSVDIGMFTGVILSINSTVLVVKIGTPDHPQFGKNVDVSITKKTTFSKVVFPNGEGNSSRGKEISILFEDLKIGDKISLIVDKNNNAISIDK